MDKKLPSRIQEFFSEEHIQDERGIQDEVGSGVLFTVVFALLLATGLFLIVRAPNA
jgi:hypothetical protein